MITNKEDITAWLDSMNIQNYTINDDFTVDVKGNVYLFSKKLTTIPIQFAIVTGNFNCSYNQLTSLKGCPTEVGGYFMCDYNLLTSLEYCPKIIGDNFSCHNNQITSLHLGPEIIGGNFTCRDNKLTNLKYCPKHVAKSIYCYNNHITILDSFPEYVGENIYLADMNVIQLQTSSCDLKGYIEHRAFKCQKINNFEAYYNEDNNTMILTGKVLNSIFMFENLSTSIAKKDIEKINKKKI